MRWTTCVFGRESPMRFGRRQIVLALCAVGTFLTANGALAQGTAPPSDASASTGQHEQMPMNMPMNTGWMFMQDGILFANFNHQGGPRGGNEFVVPNWWMGMASRETPRGRLTFTGMFSLDPATVGKDGYGEISLQWPRAGRKPVGLRFRA